MGPYWFILWAGLGPEKIFETHSIRLISMILSDFFVFRQVYFLLLWVLLRLLGPYRAILGAGMGSKKILGFTHFDYFCFLTF